MLSKEEESEIYRFRAQMRMRKEPMSDNFDLTPLLTAATTAHEMFKAFVEAGFTEDQALQIVISVLTGTLK